MGRNIVSEMESSKELELGMCGRGEGRQIGKGD